MLLNEDLRLSANLEKKQITKMDFIYSQVLLGQI